MKAVLYHCGHEMELRLETGQSYFNEEGESSNQLIDRVRKMHLNLVVRPFTFFQIRLYTKPQLFKAKRNATGVERKMFAAMILERYGVRRCRVDEPKIKNL